MFTNMRKAFTMQTGFLLFTIIGFLVEVRVNCLGSLQVKLISYTNPGGKGNNGHCCDGRSIFCESGGGCDHYFKICIDTFNSRDDSIAVCPLGSKTTGTTYDQASPTFGSYIGSTVNPMSFNFTAWQSGVKIKVEVWDNDNGGDDKVDYLKTNPALSLTPARFDRDASWTRNTLRGRTSLVVDVRASCDANWFGDDCSVFCEAKRGPNAFYSCDNTGRKVCEDGWTGVNCDQNVDDCASSPCQNQGVCVDGLRTFHCRCRQGYTGSRCETDVDDCMGIDCHNGVCVDGVNSHFCRCDSGFIGDACEETDHCLDTPCQNNGTCVNTGDGFNCTCEQGWTGQRCEEDIDECTSQPCGNYSVGCENTAGGFACTCQSGWHGRLCETDVDECQSDPCSNNGTCVEESEADDYHCLCADEWLPEYDCRVRRPPSCAEQTDLCKNNGTCVDDVTPRLISQNQAIAVTCQCLPGWAGDTCEERETEGSEVECSASFRSPCLNGGKCFETKSADAGFLCRCSGEFHGTICERRSDDGRQTSNDLEAEENSISWTFEGQLLDNDIAELRKFIVSIATKSSDLENPSEFDEHFQDENLDNESYEIVYNVQTCNYDGKKSSVFLFKLKMGNKIIEKSIAEKMFQTISSDSFKFLSPRARFIMSARIDCVPAVESALMSEKAEHQSWPVVVGVTFFTIVVLSLVAAVLIFKRKRLQKQELNISNPIYDRGAEDLTETRESGRENVNLAIDRESQQINANLFLNPSNNYGF